MPQEDAACLLGMAVVNPNNSRSLEDNPAKDIRKSAKPSKRRAGLARPPFHRLAFFTRPKSAPRNLRAIASACSERSVR